MRFRSSLQSSFLKAAGHKTVEMFNENAAKITGVVFGASDAFLTSFNYLKNGTLAIDLPWPTPDQFLSLSGGSYLSASALFLGADRFPALKKPVGALSLIGGAFAIAAGYGSGTWELYGTAVPPMLTGLSMMFENSVNAMAEQFANARNRAAAVGRFYMKYPVATMAMVQNAGAAFAFSAGINNPDQRMLIGYAALWVLGNATMALTDNNVKERVRRLYRPADGAALPAAP